MEIQDLTFSIKEDMSNLNRQIGLLQQVFLKSFLFSMKYPFIFKYMHNTAESKSKNSQTHSNSVVFVLQVCIYLFYYLIKKISESL
jgi:hypothetical protein